MFPKILLVIQIFLTIMLNLAFSEIDIHPLHKPSDADKFFEVFGNVVYVPDLSLPPLEFEKYQTKESSRVLKLPVSILTDKIGIKKGDKFSVSDFENKKTYTYHLKDFIYALTFDVPVSLGYSNLSLILSDDAKVHKKLASEMKIRDHVTGLAYIGADRKAKSFQLELVPISNVSNNDPVTKYTQNKPIKEGKLFEYKVYIYPEPSKDNTYLFFFQKPDNTFWGYLRDSHLLDDKKQNMKVYDIFEDTKVLRMYERSEGRTTAEFFILCTPSSLSILEFPGYFDPIIL